MIWILIETIMKLRLKHSFVTTLQKVWTIGVSFLKLSSWTLINCLSGNFVSDLAQ